MNTQKIVISKAKDFLAEKLASKLLQTDETELIRKLRFEGLGGFEKMSDNEVFMRLLDELPEFKLLELVGSEDGQLIIAVKEGDRETEDEIMVDIKRIIQMKF